MKHDRVLINKNRRIFRGCAGDVECHDMIASLKACAKKRNLHKGTELHAEILNKGLLARNPYVGSALVSMYAKCGAIEKAKEVFDELPVQNVVSWNALIIGYTQQGQGKEALNCFGQMQRNGISPDAVTFSCILKACGNVGDVEKGEEIHEEILKKGLLKHDIVLGNTLVDMYAKCGSVVKAEEVFEGFVVRDVVSWNTLITGYVQHRKNEEALHCLDRMQRDGISPDSVTFVCMLKACASTSAIAKGKQIHDELVNKGLLEKDIVLGTALLDMYAKCGELVKAQEVLEGLPVRDEVAWTTIITGYAQHDKGEDALNSFQRMQDEGITPTAITFSAVLKACSSTGAIDIGKKIHDEILNKKLLAKDAVLGTALVDMYAKCGALLHAEEVLSELQEQDIFSWNSLITGYAQRGQAGEAISCFKRMQSKQISADAITFLSLLHACSHSGLVNEGEMYFVDMKKKYGISPDSDHYTCMVDLYGRAGLFGKAMGMINEMPSSDYLPVWHALLGACKKWKNVKLGRLAFEQAVQLDSSNTASYTLMCSIFAAADMQNCVREIEALKLKNIAV